jgi:hypothetical protein
MLDCKINSDDERDRNALTTAQLNHVYAQHPSSLDDVLKEICRRSIVDEIWDPTVDEPSK